MVRRLLYCLRRLGAGEQGENPNTVQGIFWYSRIQTTLDLCRDEGLDEMISAQDKFIDAVGFENETVQWRVRVKLWVDSSGSAIH